MLAWLKGRRGGQPAFLYSSVGLVKGISGVTRSHARSILARLRWLALALLIVFAVPVGGWIARNYAVTGVATISTIQGFNLAYYRAAGSIAAEEHVPIDEARQRVDAVVRSETEPGMNLGDLSRVQARVGIREILDHPLGYLYTSARGLAYMLLGAAHSPVIELNRAVAVAMRDGPQAGLALVDAILERGELADYHLAHAARADLCRRMGQTAAARAAYMRALQLAQQEPERRYLERRLRELPNSA